MDAYALPMLGLLLLIVHWSYGYFFSDRYTLAKEERDKKAERLKRKSELDDLHRSLRAAKELPAPREPLTIEHHGLNGLLPNEELSLNAYLDQLVSLEIDPDWIGSESRDERDLVIEHDPEWIDRHPAR